MPNPSPSPSPSPHPNQDAHEYAQLADQLLGRAPPPAAGEPVVGQYEDRQQMPLTSEMPAVASYQ